MQCTSLCNWSRNYDTSWKEKHPWMDYVLRKGMICTVCKAFGNPPAQACGAWVTRTVNNWIKATTLLSKHEKSEWHLASVEKKGYLRLHLSMEIL